MTTAAAWTTTCLWRAQRSDAHRHVFGLSVLQCQINLCQSEPCWTVLSNFLYPPVNSPVQMLLATSLQGDHIPFFGAVTLWIAW